MDYDCPENVARTDGEQSETGGEFRVSFESLVRGKKLAKPNARINPLTQKLYPHTNGPYVAHLDRVDNEWHIWFDGNCLDPLLAFPPTETETALAVLKWLGDKWAETAGRKVYFIGSECRVGHLVKIGIAFEPHKRLSNLQTASPTPLRLLATFAGDKPEEERLHRKFSRSRVSGEWFRITPTLKRLIEHYADAPKGGNLDHA